MNRQLTHKMILIFAMTLFLSNAKAEELITQVANSGFEYWEGVSAGTTSGNEPLNWNSFITNAGSLAATARAVQLNYSDDVRPGSTGERSAVIWSRGITIPLIGTIIANGNLTTGQIQAGNMAPANMANHNRTIRANPNHSMPFTAMPDSLTVWVRFAPVNIAHQARVSAIIHGDIDYQDPNNQSAMEAYVVGKAIMNYYATEDNTWQRLSIPFDYNFEHNDPRYILITFTTNMTPGQGSANDSVYIDDMLMIFTPTLTVKNTSEQTAFVLGDEMEITFTLTGTMSPYNLNAPANVARLELSDANGSFDSPRILAQTTTDVSGVFNVEVPTDLPAGNYSVRVVTTNYPMTSETIQITVEYPETVITEYSAEICEGESFSDHNFTNLTAAGVHSLTLQTVVHGFDSIIRLNLTVHPIEIYEYSATVKEGETFSDDNFTIENATMADSRVHELIVPSIIHGCDSIIRLNLTVTPGGVSVETVNVENAVHIFPNPTRQELNIALADGLEIISLQIIDASGRVVKVFVNPAPQIDVSTLPQGIYFARIETGKGIVTKRFVKK